MKKIILFTLLSIVVLSSCITTKLETGLQRLQLGMTKQEVVSVLGKGYTVMGAVLTPDGNMETWKYTDQNVMVNNDEQIIVNFLNGRLDEWHREYLPPKPEPRNDSENQ